MRGAAIAHNRRTGIVTEVIFETQTHKAKSPTIKAGLKLICLVAGTGFEPVTFGL
jgi:hypothetical protein